MQMVKNNSFEWLTIQISFLYGWLNCLELAQMLVLAISDTTFSKKNVLGPK